MASPPRGPGGSATDLRIVLDAIDRTFGKEIRDMRQQLLKLQQSLNTTATAATKSMGKVTSSAAKAASSVKKASTSTQASSKKVVSSYKKMTNAARIWAWRTRNASAFAIKSLTSLQALLTGAGLIGGFARITNMGRDFEKGLAEVSTLVDNKVIPTMENYKDKLIEISKVAPQKLGDLTKGLYQTISAGIIDPEKAVEVLNLSRKAATAGLTDTATAVDAISTIVNSFGLNMYEASKAADLMFETVKRGKLVFETLAHNIGKVSTLAAQGGLRMEEMFASISTLTKAGLSPDIASTALRQLITSLLDPAEQAKSQFKALGLEWGDAALKGGNFTKFLRELNIRTGGSTELMSKLIPNIRALAAALVLSGDQIHTYQEDLEMMENSIGAMDVAFKKMADTADFKMRVAWNRILVILTELGGRVLPTVVRWLENFAKWLERGGSDDLVNKLKLVRDVFSDMAEYVRFMVRGLIYVSTQGLMGGRPFDDRNKPLLGDAGESNRVAQRERNAREEAEAIREAAEIVGDQGGVEYVKKLFRVAKDSGQLKAARKRAVKEVESLLELAGDASSLAGSLSADAARKFRRVSDILAKQATEIRKVIAAYDDKVESLKAVIPATRGVAKADQELLAALRALKRWEDKLALRRSPLDKAAESYNTLMRVFWDRSEKANKALTAMFHKWEAVNNSVNAILSNPKVGALKTAQALFQLDAANRGLEGADKHAQKIADAILRTENVFLRDFNRQWKIGMDKAAEAAKKIKEEFLKFRAAGKKGVDEVMAEFSGGEYNRRIREAQTGVISILRMQIPGVFGPEGPPTKFSDQEDLARKMEETVIKRNKDLAESGSLLKNAEMRMVEALVKFKAAVDGFVGQIAQQGGTFVTSIVSGAKSGGLLGGILNAIGTLAFADRTDPEELARDKATLESEFAEKMTEAQARGDQLAMDAHKVWYEGERKEITDRERGEFLTDWEERTRKMGEAAGNFLKNLTGIIRITLRMLPGTIMQTIMEIDIVELIVEGVFKGLKEFFGNAFKEMGKGGKNGGMILDLMAGTPGLRNAFHSGGYVGPDMSGVRSAAISLHGAASSIIKAHDGASIGLARDEVSSILQVGEGVLSRRGMAALEKLNRGSTDIGGGGSGTGGGVTNVFHIGMVTTDDIDNFIDGKVSKVASARHGSLTASAIEKKNDRVPGKTAHRNRRG